MSSQQEADHVGAPYEGQYAGQAIRFANRRTTEQQGRSARNRYASPPAPTHRQGHYSGIHPSDDNYNSDSFGIGVEGGDYQEEPARSRTSAVRYNNPPRRETTKLPPKPTKVINYRRFDRATLVIWVCIALIVMIVGWWLLSWVANWWQGVQDNMKYGNPRTFQADQYVGLGDSHDHPDHFIAINLHGVIEVVQINPQDHTKDAVYVLTNVGNESIPASLSFRDTSGNGKTDIVVTIGDSNPYTIVMLNNGKTFQPTQAAH